MDTTQLVIYIKTAMGSRSIREVAREAGISHPSLSRLLKGEVLPEPETLRALAPVLGLSESALMQLAGHIEERPRRLSDPEVIEVAVEIESLGTFERQKMLQVIRAAMGLAHSAGKSIEPYDGSGGLGTLADSIRWLRKNDPEEYKEFLKLIEDDDSTPYAESA